NGNLTAFGGDSFTFDAENSGHYSANPEYWMNDRDKVVPGGVEGGIPTIVLQNQDLYLLPPATVLFDVP
ncbi:hypothetical protein CRD36_13960, partial [Paremcibacter congregatus]